MKQPTVTLIWAMSDNRVIGKDGQLPWHLPDDLRRFKTSTAAGSMIMGRKTWESIGARPLPGRQHIVVTRNADYAADGALCAPNLGEALALATGSAVFVIGGSVLFEDALPIADRLEVTHVHGVIDGDVVMPPVDWSRWSITSDEAHSADDAHPYPFSFRTYERAGRSCASSEWNEKGTRSG